MAASYKKPKTIKSSRSDRPNGKAVKQHPKTNPLSTGKTNLGYTTKAINRRVSIRDTSFKGLTTRSR